MAKAPAKRTKPAEEPAEVEAAGVLRERVPGPKANGRSERTELTATRFRAICMRLEDTGAKYQSCELEGFSYQAVAAAIAVQEQRENPTWRELWDKSYQRFVESLEVEGRRRARDGVEEPVFGRIAKDCDGEIGTVRKYSDSLLTTMLKAHKPEMYRENVHHTGDPGSFHTSDILTQLSPEAKKLVRDIIMKDLAAQREQGLIGGPVTDAEFTEVEEDQ